MSGPTRLPDQQARDEAAGLLAESAFIEAGAGTGKSTTLVTRILNLLTGPAAVPMASIAAITFTERAGAELRHRIRAQITDRIQDGSVTPADRDRLRAALADLDAAPIGTIHSFAQRILRTHCLSAALPLGFEPATGADAAEDARARVRSAVEHLQEHLDPGVAHRLADYGLRPYDLLGAVRALDSAWLRLDDAAFTGTAIDLVALCGTVADTFEDFLQRATADCAVPTDTLLTRLSAGVAEVVGLLRRADPAELAADPTNVRRVFKLGNCGTAAAWGPGGAKARREEFKELAVDLDACLLAPLEVAVRSALAQAWRVMDEHRRERARHGVVTFDELLARARDLVRDDADVRRHVHAEFAVVLVDEFQDTDPVQWELVRRITADPDDAAARPLPGRLVVVGDPKQAIYAFRGADIDTYTAALREFTRPADPVGRVFELSTNFRSVGPLIDWVNDVFATAMAAQPEQVRYRPLDLRHRPSAAHPGPAVTVVRDPEPADPEPVDSEPVDAEPVDSEPADPPAGSEPAGPLDSPDAALDPEAEPSVVREPRLVAQEISRAVRDGWLITEPADAGSRRYARAATFSDIAVLYPARTGVPALLDALDAAGVPYRSGDAGLVFQRPVILGLLAALAVVDDPSRELDLWVALKSPLFACTDVDLLDFRTAGGSWRVDVEPVDPSDQPIPGPVADALATLRTTRRELSLRQPTAVIDRLLHETRIMPALAYAPRGDFDADCVRMLRAHAQQFQDDGGIGLPDYLAAIADAQSDPTRSALAEPDVRDDNAVRLMTVHQAKGLEFPIVVLAGMASNRYSPTPTIGVVDRGRYEFSLGSGLRSVEYRHWNETSREPRDLAERLRLLYVACTRARDHLIVSICGEHGSRRNPHAELLWRAVPRQPGDVTELDEPPVLPPALVSLRADPLPADWPERVERTRQRSRRPGVAAPSGAAAAALGLAAPSPDADPPRPAADPPAVEQAIARTALAARDGRPLGRAVHAALDRLVRGGPAAARFDVDAACLAAATEEGIAAQADQVAARVEAALGCDLLVAAMAAPRRWTELYLAAPVDAGSVRLVEGFADLVFEREDGLVLVDYKTDEAISDQTLRHYGEQLDSYAELIRRVTGRAVAGRHIVHVTHDSATVLTP